MPGQHQVKATKDGFQDWQGRVTITPHKTATLRIEMNPKKDLPKTFTNSIGMRFVLIPAGSFMMGSPEGQGDDDEHPQHLVKITRPFYLQTYEVRIKSFLKFLNDIKGAAIDGIYSHRIKKNNGKYVMKKFLSTNPGSVNWPMVDINLKAANLFCGWLNEKENTTKYRLPTEAEWEYACRAGSTTRWSFGDDWIELKNYAPYKIPNKWGLYGMHGSVWEICSDWYQDDYYSVSPVEDPQGPNSGHFHVARGGKDNSYPKDVYASRSANREEIYTSRMKYRTGLRVLREP